MAPIKTDEQRREDATSALEDAGYSRTRAESLVKLVLEAADAPPKPKWPTDESYACLSDDTSRENLRDAMVRDPIIKAAIEYRDSRSTDLGKFRGPEGSALIAAVNEAGL